MERITIKKQMSHIDDVQSFATQLAGVVDAGFVIALDGDLGAGKTTFSQFFAKGLGVQAVVNSPTFTIIKEYRGATLPFYHMDVYRISIDEADELGLDDYFFGDGVTVVEWASIINDLFPNHYMHINIRLQEDNTRLFIIEAIGERYVHALKQLESRGN